MKHSHCGHSTIILEQLLEAASSEPLGGSFLTGPHMKVVSKGLDLDLELVQCFSVLITWVEVSVYLPHCHNSRSVAFLDAVTGNVHMSFLAFCTWVGCADEGSYVVTNQQGWSFWLNSQQTKHVSQRNSFLCSKLSSTQICCVGASGNHSLSLQD